MDKDPFTGLLESVEIAAMVRDLADFYFDDLPNRRLRPDIMTKAQAAEAAQAFARAERDKSDNQ